MCDSGKSSDLSRVNLPLTFHYVHGKNVELSLDRRRAKRVRSFDYGICFSARPIAIGERVFLKCVDTDTLGYGGALWFGFTSTDPGSMRGEDLPCVVHADRNEKLGTGVETLAIQYADAGNELFFHLNLAGDVFYGVNGEDKGLFLSDVNTSGPLWALLDIYGNTTCVEFVN